MLNIIGRQQGGEYLAAISFGFDRRKPDAGPFLDPINPQSKYAPALLHLVATKVLSDPAYVARLERHYRKSKGARPQASGDPQWDTNQSEGERRQATREAQQNADQPVRRGRRNAHA
jgi:hypothetical protein